MSSLLLALLAFTLAALMTRQFCSPTSWFHILDIPNDRSLHASPTPRTGGIAIVFALIATVAIFAADNAGHWPMEALAIGVVAIGLTSYADDRVGVGIGLRFFIHLLAASVFVVGTTLGDAELTAFAVARGIFAAFFVVWMINLYNFMDGMDGFAGGMGVIGFGAFAWLGWAQGEAAFATLNLLAAAACAGFLVFNFPPARIFMGDVGSTTLGFLAGAFTLWGIAADLFSWPVGLLVFSPFTVDATVTLLRRLRRGENIFKAHRSHYYQRAVQLGLGHRDTVLYEYALMAGCAVTATWLNSQTVATQWFALLVWGLIYGLAMAAVTKAERTRRTQ